MAVRLVLAGLSLALVGAVDFSDDTYRAKDRLRAPYDTDRQRPLEGIPSFKRAAQHQLSLAAPSNGSMFENAPLRSLVSSDLANNVAIPAPSNATGDNPLHKSQNSPLEHKAFFERGPANPVFGLEQQPGSDEASKQLVDQDMSKLQRRKFRLHHRKSLKERKSRKIQKLLDDELPRELAGPGAGAASLGVGGAGPDTPQTLQRSADSASRVEALAGLKVEYARAYIAAEEPEADSAPMELLCTVGFKEYATISWTVNGRPLENFIDRSTLSTVKNDVPVKVSKITINQLERLPSENGKFVFECTALVDAQVTKATIALGSIIEDSCTQNSQCEARGASCSEGRCLCKTSQPVSLKSKHLTCRAASGLSWPCDYSEQCVFTNLNTVCTDRLVCDCSLGFVKSLDGKTCDKLTPGNLVGSPCKTAVDCHTAGAACMNGICACANDTVERGGMCVPLAHLKMGLDALRGPSSLGNDDVVKTVQNDTRFTLAAMINDPDKEKTTASTAIAGPLRAAAGDVETSVSLLAGALAMAILARGP